MCVFAYTLFLVSRVELKSHFPNVFMDLPELGNTAYVALWKRGNRVVHMFEQPAGSVLCKRGGETLRMLMTLGIRLCVIT